MNDFGSYRKFEVVFRCLTSVYTMKVRSQLPTVLAFLNKHIPIIWEGTEWGAPIMWPENSGKHNIFRSLSLLSKCCSSGAISYPSFPLTSSREASDPGKFSWKVRMYQTCGLIARSYASLPKPRLDRVSCFFSGSFRLQTEPETELSFVKPAQ